MTDKLKVLLRKEFPLWDVRGANEAEDHCELTLFHDRKRLHALLDAFDEPAVEAAEIEVVGFELCVDGYSPVLIRDESHADREFEYYKGLGMKVALNPLHRRILAGVNQQAGSGWIEVTERLPEPGVTVLVYSPPQPGDYPDTLRIAFDGIDPESDGTYWVDHGEHYEHWCCVAKGGDADWHGPSEKAPYTHWQPLPPSPAAKADA